MPNFLNQQYPATRMRRNRDIDAVRRLTQESYLSASDFIQPFFVIEGDNKQESITAMPETYRYSIDLLVEQAKQTYHLGIPAIAIFPKIDIALKDAQGSEALNPDNLVCRAVRAVKQTVPELMVICDVALDPYTTHGHDGVLNDSGDVDNDASIEILVKQALMQAKAGCDTLAPSDMMDGRVGAIRMALEAEKLTNIRIMSYAAKYASGFYAPFREAVGSGALLTGDKKSYQMNPANHKEALQEIALDIQEGADLIIVKPGMPYLDIIARASDAFTVPIIAYQVSGEYSMLMGANNPDLMLESLLCFKRAGASGIITYYAMRAAEYLAGNLAK